MNMQQEYIADLNVRSEIRFANRVSYIDREREQDRAGNYLTRLLYSGSAVSGFLGLGAVIFSAPLALAIAAGVAFVALGIGGMSVSDRAAAGAEKRAEDALNRDIENFSLVNSYLKLNLPFLQQNLDNAAKRHNEAEARWRAQHQAKQQELDERRKAAIRLVSQGLEILESQANASLEQVELYRKEAAAIGAEFGGAAQKPQPARTASLQQQQLISKGNTP